MPASSEHPSQSLFVSYSRDDLGFAMQLCYSLRAFGHKVSIDHAELQGGEEWRRRLEQLVREADSVIFVLSPSSANSEVCRWEVDTAVGLAKRIIPIVCAPLGDAAPHPRLSVLNYIFFYADKASPDSGFGKGLATLVEALSQDVEWLRDHTRLTEMAAHWTALQEAAGDAPQDAEDLLLRGSALEAYREWRARRPATAPLLTPLQTSFLDASEARERREQDEARSRFEAMQQAQEERQKALDEAAAAQEARERATTKLVRRTFAGIAVAALLSAGVVWYAIAADRNAKAAASALERTQAEQRLQDRMLQFIDNRDHPERPFTTLSLSRRYEGQEPDHVSRDFEAGGYSYFYGTYRIKAGANLGEFLKFLDRAGSFDPRAREFYAALTAAGGTEAASSGATAFAEAWKAQANDPQNGAFFAEIQEDFVKENDYKRLHRRLSRAYEPSADPAKTGLGLDVCKRSLALQAAVFSIAVQYGPDTPLPVNAMSGIDVPAALADEDVIARFYAERDKVETYFPDLGSTRYWELVVTRNTWEESDALYILENEGEPPGRCV